MNVIVERWDKAPTKNEDGELSGIVTVVAEDNDLIRLPVELFGCEMDDFKVGNTYDVMVYSYLENLFFVAKDEEDFKSQNPDFAPESSIPYGIMPLEENYTPSPRIYLNVKINHIVTMDEFPHQENVMLLEAECQSVPFLISIYSPDGVLPTVLEGNYMSGEFYLEAYLRTKETVQ